MMRRETPFVIRDQLIFVHGRVTGPKGTSAARFVLDTGCALTTITPELASDVGYRVSDGYRRTRVRTAIGSEGGHMLKVESLSAILVAARAFPVHVFDLGHDDIDGLLGMNFLSLLNYEVRSAEHRIFVELIERGALSIM